MIYPSKCMTLYAHVCHHKDGIQNVHHTIISYVVLPQQNLSISIFANKCLILVVLYTPHNQRRYIITSITLSNMMLYSPPNM